MNSGNSSTDKGNPLDIAAIALFIVPLVYTSGWSYAYHYFGNFHCGLIGIDIPKEYFFLYSLATVLNRPILMAMLMVGLGSFPFFVRWTFVTQKQSSPIVASDDTRFKRYIRKWRRKIVICLMPLIVILFFIAFYYTGGSAAASAFEKQREAGFDSFARVKVWLAKGPKKVPGNVAVAWGKGCYRLLLKTKDNVYIFISGNGSEKIPTDVIPVSQIRSLRVLPVYQNCN